MSYECFKVDVENGIAVVTMDRPPVNAQNAKFRDEITSIFDTFSDDSDIRVILPAA